METRFIKRVLLILMIFCGFLTQRTSAQIWPSIPMTVFLASSNGVKTVWWSDSPFYGFLILQTAQSLSPTATWTNLATDNQFVSLNSFPISGGYAMFVTNRISTQSGTYATLSWAPTDQQLYFRLRTPSPIPACCFAVFYNGLLEFTQCPTMTINGRVHASDSIYVGTTATLTFNGGVSTMGTLTAPFMDGLTSGWIPGISNTWNTIFHAGYITNTGPDLMIPALSKYVNHTNYHFLIDIPPASEDPMSVTGLTRIYNQAQMVLLVTNSPSGTNTTVWLTVQTSINGQVPGADPSPLILYYTNASPALLSTNLPFLNLTNRFYDQREYKTNLVTQVDIGNLASWI